MSRCPIAAKGAEEHREYRKEDDDLLATERTMVGKPRETRTASAIAATFGAEQEGGDRSARPERPPASTCGTHG